MKSQHGGLQLSHLSSSLLQPPYNDRLLPFSNVKYIEPRIIGDITFGGESSTFRPIPPNNQGETNG